MHSNNQHKLPQMVKLDAEPEQLAIDAVRAAIVIIDMQNAFVSEGAYIDLVGLDFTKGRAIIPFIQDICRNARERRWPVIYVYTVHYPGDAGNGPESVFWHKEKSLTSAHVRLLGSPYQDKLRADYDKGSHCPLLYEIFIKALYNLNPLYP